MSRIAPYQRIKTAVQDRVRSGAWMPGDRIPGETQLANDFGCARATVHRALRELAEEGILERRRKTGTRVALPSARSVAIAISQIEEEIVATGAAYDYRLLYREMAPPPPAEAAALGTPPNREALHLRCLHLADRQPYQFEDRWINPSVVPQALSESFDCEGPNSWLVRHVPWTDAEHSIYADSAAGLVAEALSLSEGEPVLVLERRTRNDRGPATIVRFYHPGRNHRLRASFSAR